MKKPNRTGISNKVVVRTVSCILVIFAVMMLTGCSVPKHGKKTTEEDVVKKVEDYFLTEYRADVKAKVVGKETLSVPTFWFDGPAGYTDVKGSYEYSLEITYKKYPGQTFTATFRDEYYLDGNLHESVIHEQFERVCYDLDMEKEFIAAADSVLGKKNYVFQRDLCNTYDYDIFTSEGNYTKICILIDALNSIIADYREEKYTSYSIYIFSEKKAFAKSDFSKVDGEIVHGNFYGLAHGSDVLEKLYENRETVKIGYCKDGIPCKTIWKTCGFDSEHLLDECEITKDDVDFFVGWYYCEPNALSHRGNFYTFGIKK